MNESDALWNEILRLDLPAPVKILAQHMVDAGISAQDFYAILPDDWRQWIAAREMNESDEKWVCPECGGTDIVGYGAGDIRLANFHEFGSLCSGCGHKWPAFDSWDDVKREYARLRAIYGDRWYPTDEEPEDVP